MNFPAGAGSQFASTTVAGCLSGRSAPPASMRGAKSGRLVRVTQGRLVQVLRMDWREGSASFPDPGGVAPPAAFEPEEGRPATY